MILVKELAKSLLWKLSPRLYERITRPYSGQVFSIGICRGSSPLELQKHLAGATPILTAADIHDAPAVFVADPFIVSADQRWYIFFEIYNRARFQGEIGVASSTDGIRWRYHQIVLSESHHLAYPQVFREGDDFFMIPDTAVEGVKLYRASRFPDKWEFEKTLLDDKQIMDPTVFRHDGRWWMISGYAPDPSGARSTRLHYADRISGPWTEHPSSPIIRNDLRKARPAGAMIHFQNRLFRLSQDCTTVYGESVSAHEILELTPESYREVDCQKILEPGDLLWRADGMHHASFVQIGEDQWITAVDGWYSTSNRTEGKQKLDSPVIRTTAGARSITKVLTALLGA